YLFYFERSELSVLTALFSLLPSLQPPTLAYISGEARRISLTPVSHCTRKQSRGSAQPFCFHTGSVCSEHLNCVFCTDFAIM
ncbi:hypothetical protein M9458_007230, partial [Cirrhinus mrigala]